MKSFYALLFTISTITAYTQDYRWQQEVDYTMDVALDTKTHKLTGDQKLIYTNNSTDTLQKVYYHLFFNAFQPGSMMDIRSQNLRDPDPRVKDRISKLKDNEIGYQRILALTQDGYETNYTTVGTILEVNLPKPILPGAQTVFQMKFEALVPIQIRRSGRDSKEGISYSMTQWYPKLAEYDFQGWHAYPYVAREFHGVWGNYDVKITLAPEFVVAGSGVLQNPAEIGHGYESEGVNVKKSKGPLTWHFKAQQVHDFAWAADPDYAHTLAQVPGGPMLHFFYQPGEKTTENWTKLKDYSVKHFLFMNEKFGQYPYPVYSIIQGGDGGMEYPMCTLITGERSLGSLVGVTVHEASHSWFQGVLANNEALYPWMDEGFTDFASNESMALLFNSPDPHADAYASYFMLVEKGLQEPLGQHSDHYNTNTAYGIAAYSMGGMFLNQLKYIMGEDSFYKGMRRYYNTWKFRHPEPNDFIRVMEKESGLQLHWFYRNWILTTKHIDYAVTNVSESQNKTTVTLSRIGTFPMPVEILVRYKDGSAQGFYIPLNEMLGGKFLDNTSMTWNRLSAWNWVNPTYAFTIDKRLGGIESVEIDPKKEMADIDGKNNAMSFKK